MLSRSNFGGILVRRLAIAMFCVINASIWAQSQPAGRSRGTNKQMDRADKRSLSDPALQADSSAGWWLTAESQRGTLIWQNPFAQVDDDGLLFLPVTPLRPPDADGLPASSEVDGWPASSGGDGWPVSSYAGEEGFGALPAGFWYDREKEGLYAYIGGYSLGDALDDLEVYFDADVDQLIASQPLLLDVLREYGTTPGGGSWVEADAELLDDLAAASATGFLAPEDPGDPPADGRAPEPIPLPPVPLERCWAWLGLVGCPDGNPCTLDRCVSDDWWGGVCTHTPLSGAPCDDGDPCTVGDRCVWRSCLGGPQFDCDDGDPCTIDSCGCPEGAPDCTPTCYHFPLVWLCEDDGNPCSYATCLDGECHYIPVIGGGTCEDDGNECTDDVCSGGACTHPPSSGPQCADDGDPCTDDVCNGGVCTHPPSSGPCADDGNPCRDDFCVDGACTHPATSGPCTDDGNQCTDDRCSGGNCTHPPNSASCDDGNPCTENDTCSGGTCAGTQTDCDDSNPCTDDTCLYGICSRLPNGNPGCEDGPCPGGCDDGNGCTVDSCENGTCTYTPHTGPCDDENDACTENDTCSNGACVGTTVDCTQYPGVDACSTNIHCEPDVGCVWDWPCNDDDPCTTDSCAGGSCTNTAVDCDSPDGDCEGSGTPNTGESEVQSSMVLCLSTPDSIPVVHRIVTHDTPRARDLYGMLRLSRVSGDATVVDIRYLGQPYALGSPIPVVESGHAGCLEHTWHAGVATFSLTPRKTGEVTLKAQVDPDPECCEGNGVSTVEAQVTVSVVGAAAIHVDATDPRAAEVTYSVSPGTVVIDSATFTAPGTIETRANITGEFSFTFDQKNLLAGDNQIRLDYTIGSNTCSTEATATRTTTHAPPLGTMQEVAFFKVLVENSLVTVPVLHSIWGQFAFICYSIDVLPGSKTLWVGRAKVNISTDQAPGIPTEIAAWGETHLYRDVYGDHLEQPMVPVTGPTIPAQGPYFRSMELDVDAFFVPNDNLTGVGAVESLFFDDPNGAILAIPVLNTTIDLALETNADPSVSCP